MRAQKTNSPPITTDRLGAVTLHGDGFHETWRPWGHPDGFGVEGCKRASYNNQLEPLMSSPILETGSVAKEFRHIRESVPEEIRQCAVRFSHWQIEHLQLAECHPVGYLHLADQNPALLNHLASLSAQHTLWGPKHWGSLLGNPQKHIALQSGLDPRMVRYLSRITDEGLITHGYLEFAIAAWRKIGMARLLTHLGSVNLDVMLLALNEWDLVRDCPSLLHIAAEQGPMDTVTFHTVAAIRSALRRARRPWRWDKVNGFQHLARIRDRVLADAATGGGTLVYPPPPISPCSDWKAITTDAELAEHAETHGNCALEHSWKLASGVMAIYESRRTSPMDSVIVVLAKEQGRWVVQDVLGSQNALVDTELEESIRRDFGEVLFTDCGKIVESCGKEVE